MADLADRRAKRGSGLRGHGQNALAAAATAAIAGLLLVTATLAARPGSAHMDSDIGFTVAAAPPATKVASAKTSPRGTRADAGWARQVAARSDIGPVAAIAYGTTALRLATERPGCKVGWTTLAGIGSVETNHGTDGGVTLLPDGTTTRPILGPALDGSGDMAAIHSDHASVDWHGDSSWDHAVGPMQFIPSTWKSWGADASGDGMADPNNIDDAAYSAGLYLCASGGDMTTAEGWSKAVFSYNHSDDYVRNVLARANKYAATR